VDMLGTLGFFRVAVCQTKRIGFDDSIPRNPLRPNLEMHCNCPFPLDCRIGAGPALKWLGVVQR